MALSLHRCLPAHAGAWRRQPTAALLLQPRAHLKQSIAQSQPAACACDRSLAMRGAASGWGGCASAGSVEPQGRQEVMSWWAACTSQHARSQHPGGLEPPGAEPGAAQDVWPEPAGSWASQLHFTPTVLLQMHAPGPALQHSALLFQQMERPAARPPCITARSSRTSISQYVWMPPMHCAGTPMHPHALHCPPCTAARPEGG